ARLCAAYPADLTGRSETTSSLRDESGAKVSYAPLGCKQQKTGDQRESDDVPPVRDRPRRQASIDVCTSLHWYPLQLATRIIERGNSQCQIRMIQAPPWTLLCHRTVI